MVDVVEPEWRPVTHELAELARAYGVATEYWDQGGNYKAVGAATVEAVLRALGVDTSSSETIWAALRGKHEEAWRRTIPPVYIARQGVWNECWVHLPDGDWVRARVELEDGSVRDLRQVDKYVAPQYVDGQLTGEATFEIPGDLPLGWHTLKVETTPAKPGKTKAINAECQLVVTPDRLDPAVIRQGRQWGFMTQVYAQRSASSWGIGDISDLAELAAWSAHEHGADYVLVNPLHAASPVPPMEPSPYLPVTRRFANPVYISVEWVPEYAKLSQADRDRLDKLAAPVRALNSSSELIDRDAVWEAKSAALKIIREVPLTTGRRALFEAFKAREGKGLVDFATWCSLTEDHGDDFTEWPAELQDASSGAVAAYREANEEKLDWHMWLQWVIDEQLSRAQQCSTSAGMRSGIVHDLAVGVHPLGSDAWGLRDVLAQGVSVGAPPDMYNQMGQNWSQPPWRPDALAEAGFIPYRDMLRTVLRHAGGIRVDHVLGLFRLWWIPEGMPAYCGTYVKSDFEALVGILALEAQRAGAWLVGEDLGTVEEWVQHYLLSRGVLGTTIMWFERVADGPKPPEQWRPNCMASVTVHDLPPTAGYLAGEHVKIRGDLGLLTRPAEEELAQSNTEIEEWKQLAQSKGLLGPDPSEEDVIVALHRVLAASPSVILGLALTDAVGDRRPQNQPGTDKEYPNWRVPLCDGNGNAVLVEDLGGVEFLARLVAAVRGN